MSKELVECEKHGTQESYSRGAKRKRACKRCEIERVKPYNVKNRVKNREQYNAKRRRYRKKWKLVIFQHYSENEVPFCACCKETTFEFLTLDHINGDGSAHRREIGKGDRLHTWIIKNNYPPLFRILCYNCNCARGRCGICPHQRSVATSSFTP